MVEGQTGDAKAVGPVSGSAADLLHQLERVGSPSARSCLRLPCSCKSQSGCKCFGVWKDLLQS